MAKSSKETLKYTYIYRYHGAYRCGKTTTSERILFYAGLTHKLGEGARWSYNHGLDGTGTGTRYSISSAATTTSWQYRDQTYKINLIDTRDTWISLLK